MKKKNILMVLICCLLYCVTAFAANMTMEDFIGVDNAIEQSMPKSDYFKMNQHTNLNDNIHSKRSFYDVKIYMDQRGKGLIVDKQFTVSVDKIYHDDWVFASGSSDIGKENEF